MKLLNHKIMKTQKFISLTINCETNSKPNKLSQPLSQFIDVNLKHFLIYIKSYVKDNLNFLRKFSRKNNESAILLGLT